MGMFSHEMNHNFEWEIINSRRRGKKRVFGVTENKAIEAHSFGQYFEGKRVQLQ